MSTITSIVTHRSQYPTLLHSFSKLSEEDQIAKIKNLCTNDLFFLLVYGLNRPDADSDWVFDRCREVQAEPDNRLDLWAREHYKSTVITFALTIQDILNNPELTFGIFSHTRPIAKGFLRQIKREFESNERLKKWFSDILWAAPHKEAPKWSEDEGIVVKRKGNPKEATVEAWGLVDGQPTSKHYKRMIYDDTVTRESVTTPEMIAKVTEAWELSRNLSSEGGATRYIGTRYHFNDTYNTMMSRGITPRIYPATDDGKVDGAPVHLSRARLDEKYTEMGAYTFGCQMLQNPTADRVQGFKEEWLRHYEKMTRDGLNVCILVDAASEKKKDSDYTAYTVLGFASDRNVYVLDLVRDRLSLTERAAKLFELHAHWKPNDVGYEKYGMMADIEHIQSKMEDRNYRFPITELGGSMPKPDRIRRLIPEFEHGKIWLPQKLDRIDYQGRSFDLVEVFKVEEYKPFPVMLHDDMLDSLSRVYDLYPGGYAKFPWPIDNQVDDPYSVGDSGGGWMAA